MLYENFVRVVVTGENVCVLLMYVPCIGNLSTCRVCGNS